MKLDSNAHAELRWALGLQPGTARRSDGALVGTCPDCQQAATLSIDGEYACAGPCLNEMAAAALVSHAETFYAPDWADARRRRNGGPVEPVEPVELAPIPEYPVEALPIAARNLIGATSLPAGLVAGAALAALASAIGSNATLEVMPDSWSERANLWIALLAERGAGKSPAMRLAFRPLHARDALVGDEKEPLLTTDATPEAIGRVMRDGDGGACLYLDELSVLLRGMGEYSGGGARGRWLALWTGDPWRVTRVASGGEKLGVDIRIPNPTAIIVGNLQPALHELLGGDEDGLRPRWLPHYAVASTEPLRRGSAPRSWGDLIGYLLDDRSKQREWRLSDEAFEAFQDHRRRWLAEADDASESLAAALAKAPGHLARTALVLTECNAHGRGGAVLPSIVNRAARIIDYTLASWRALPEYGGLALTRRDAVLDQGVSKLLAWLERQPGRTADSRTLLRAHVAGVRTAAELDALLERHEATFPGTVIYESPPHGGRRKRVVRAPGRSVVASGDIDTRTDANPHARAEYSDVASGDIARGDIARGDIARGDIAGDTAEEDR